MLTSTEHYSCKLQTLSPEPFERRKIYRAFTDIAKESAIS
jgi:hypothetical protein